MAAYDPRENVERIKNALVSNAVWFASDFAHKSRKFIIVFDVEPNDLAAGNILLFQRDFLERFGQAPVLIKVIPACVKAYFDVDMPDTLGSDFKDYFSSERFKGLAKQLEISQVQAGREIFHYK